MKKFHGIFQDYFALVWPCGGVHRPRGVYDAVGGIYVFLSLNARQLREIQRGAWAFANDNEGKRLSVFHEVLRRGGVRVCAQRLALFPAPTLFRGRRDGRCS